MVHQHRPALGEHLPRVGRGGGAQLHLAGLRPGVRFDAQQADRVGLTVFERGHLHGLHRQKLAQGAVESFEHAALVERRSHRTRDAVQRLEPASLVAGQLVEGGVREQDAEAAVDLLEKADFRGRDAARAVRLIDDGPDELALVFDRRPDDEPDALPGAGTATRLLCLRPGGQHRQLRVGVLASECRAAHRPAAAVLQHARVDGQHSIPPVPLQDGQEDDVVAEPGLQVAVEDLQDVGFGQAARELVDELGGSRRRNDRRGRPPGLRHRRSLDDRSLRRVPLSSARG